MSTCGPSKHSRYSQEYLEEFTARRLRMEQDTRIQAMKKHMPERNAGFYLSPGWIEIAWELHCKIIEEFPDYALEQVKEKFGGLRYYFHPWNDTVSLAESRATQRSLKTCEECGKPGQLMVRSQGLWKTVCEEYVANDPDGKWEVAED